MKNKFVIAGIVCLVLAAAIILATILMAWPQTAAQTIPPVELIPTATASTTVPTLQDEVATYLNNKKSPLADHTETLLQQKDWKLILAISNAESTFCRHQLFYNCWGIKAARGQPATIQGYAKYKSFDDGLEQTEKFLEKWQAKGRWLTVADMNCSYVVPCSPSWVRNVNSTLSELKNF